MLGCIPEMWIMWHALVTLSCHFLTHVTVDCCKQPLLFQFNGWTLFADGGVKEREELELKVAQIKEEHASEIRKIHQKHQQEIDSLKKAFVEQTKTEIEKGTLIQLQESLQCWLCLALLWWEHSKRWLIIKVLRDCDLCSGHQCDEFSDHMQTEFLLIVTCFGYQINKWI